MSTIQELEQELEAQKEARQRLEEQAEEMRIRHEMEVEKLKTKELELSMQHLKEATEAAESSHKKKIAELEKATDEMKIRTEEEAAKWLEKQLLKLKGNSPAPDPEQERKRQEEQEKQAKIQELQKQLREFTGEAPEEVPKHKQAADSSQQLLLQQLRAALEPKQGDPQKDTIRALITESNRIQGVGGTSTLRPDILARLTGDSPASMQEWLAHLNQQEGEYIITNREGEGEGIHLKIKSGMLDKSTTAIKSKQTWPQRNLGEDWADEELDFKQIKFEHLVAGETHTIETCTEPAQILGRL